MRTPSDRPSAPRPTWRGGLVVALVIAVATTGAYWNSLAVPFVFDDLPSIAENAAIRELASALALRHGEGGLTVNGRPLVALSLALNWKVSGPEVWSYHVFNLLVHVGAALVFFGVVRRTLKAWEARSKQTVEGMGWLAGAAALGWALHPLQTAAVTYVVQRAEAMAGFFYLLTLYGFIRSADERAGGRWRAVSGTACLLGVLCKEIVVTAPLVVLLHDRTFVAGSFRAAWSARRNYYLALGASWLVVAFLVFAAEGRGGTAGLGTAITPWSYALTQAQALWLYLKLVCWPHPLIFDYGVAISSWAEAWLAVVGVNGVLAATVWALWRRPVAGYGAAVALLLLAPSSSVVPVATQTMAEHRLYLALGVGIVALAMGLMKLARPTGGAMVLGVVALLWGGMTVARNADYQSAQTLWADTVRKRPQNARAHNNLGFELFRAGRTGEALAYFREAVRLQPDYAEAHFNLGAALAQRDDARNAQIHYREALRVEPGFARAHFALAQSLEEAGERDEARGHYEAAVKSVPEFADAHFRLGNLLAEAGQLPEALGHFEAAARIRPGDRWFETNLANALYALGRTREAIARFESVVAVHPDFVPPRRNLAYILAQEGRTAEATRQFEALVRLQPAEPEFRGRLKELRGW
jgi:tetratricopeptide (TPR) repeat protein